MIFGVLYGLLGYLLFLVVCLWRFHLKSDPRPLKSFGLTYLVFLPLFFFPLIFGYSFPALPFPETPLVFIIEYTFLTTLIFAFAVFSGLHVWNLFDDSITMRMLVHIYRTEKKEMTISELQKIYPFDEFMKGKVLRAVQNGDLTQIKDAPELTFHPAPRSLLLGRAFYRLKTFCQWGKGG